MSEHMENCLSFLFSWFLLTEPCFLIYPYFLLSTAFLTKIICKNFLKTGTNRLYLLFYRYPGTLQSGPILNHVKGLRFPWTHKQGISFQIWARAGPWLQPLMDFPPWFHLDQYKFHMLWVSLFPIHPYPEGLFFMTQLHLRRVPRRLLGLDKPFAEEAVEIGSLCQNLYKWLHCFTYLSGFSLFIILACI